MGPIGGISGNSISQIPYISSGKRILGAADDPSGMVMSESMKSQETGQTAANQNTQQGISAANVTDGALAGISDYLQRIKELAVKSQNGLMTKDDKQAIQKEIDQNIEGINKIGEGTEFNTKNVLDGTQIQVASQRNGQGPNIMGYKSTAEALGIQGFSVMGDKVDMKVIDDAIKTVSDMRSGTGASVNGLESAYSYGQQSAQEALASRSRVEDLDMERSVSEEQKNSLLEEYSNMMIKKKQEEEAGLVSQLFQQN